MSFNNIRMAPKLWGTIVGLLLLLTAMAIGTQLRSSAASEAATLAVRHYQQATLTALQWNDSVTLNTERVLAAMTNADPQQASFFEQRQKAGSAQVVELQKQVEANATSEADQAALNNIRQVRDQVMSRLSEILKAKNASNIDTVINQEFLPLVQTYQQALDNFVVLQQQQRDMAIEQGEEVRKLWMFLGLLGAAIVLVIGMVGTFILVRSITQPLHEVVEAATRIGQGDLTQSLQSQRRDEFGDLTRALASMSQNLRGLVNNVRQGIQSVSHASEEIAQGNYDLASRTEQSAASIQETAASMEEITATITQSADTADKVNQFAIQAAQAASTGSAIAAEVGQRMHEITASSGKINEIISVIDSIAFQTNILALNAAVEAARAGEQGRGFAVVAAEVRALASRSAQAAKEIKTLIVDSEQTVLAGSAQVDQAGAAMLQLVEQINHVSTLIGEIHASANEQRDGVSQVNQAIGQLDAVAQGNAALVEESASATAALNEQATRLAQAMSIFNLGDQNRLAITDRSSS